VGSKRLSKVLMDGASVLNVMDVETFHGLGIARSMLRPSPVPFHDIIPGHQAYPLGRIMLTVMFSDASNFRIERLEFEVANFPGSYNTILGRPCSAKFMVVPNYTYLMLKMPSTRGIITVSVSLKAAYTCEQANCELASLLTAIKEIAEL
jgi:hypothetical protein